MTPSISTRVVLAVAAEEGVDPEDLPPISDVIDPDALDRLFRDGRTRQDGPSELNEVRFPYAGFTVRIRDGEPTLDRTAGEPGAGPGGR